MENTTAIERWRIRTIQAQWSGYKLVGRSSQPRAALGLVRGDDGQFYPPRMEVRDTEICRFPMNVSITEQAAFVQLISAAPLLLEACHQGARGMADPDAFTRAIKLSELGVWDDRRHYYSENEAIQWIGQAVEATGHWDAEFQRPSQIGKVITTVPADMDWGPQFWELGIHWEGAVTESGVKVIEYLDRQIVDRFIRPIDVEPEV